MMENFFLKIKKIAKITFFILLVVGILALIVYGVLYYKKLNYKEVKNAEVTAVSAKEVISPEKPERPIKFENDNLSLQVKQQNEKILELEKTISGLKKATFVQDSQAHILITLSLIETKLNNGGSIINEIIKLKTFSVKVPEINIFVQSFENIKFLESKENLKLSFDSYVKVVKSENIKNTNTKFSWFFSFVARYLTILNSENPQDSKLLQMKEFIKENNFVSAFEKTKEINISTPEVINFLIELENSAKVQEGVNKIYLFVGNNLSDSEGKK